VRQDLIVQVGLIAQPSTEEREVFEHREAQAGLPTSWSERSIGVLAVSPSLLRRK
jgi:hypothetical protein